jgi:hypothetical protein
MKSRNLLAALIVILVVSLSAVAQTAPNFENGFKPFGSYEGSHLDSVNLMNGNLMLHAPLIPDLSQRGALGVSHTLYATSKDWQTVCVSTKTGENCSWQKGGGGITIIRTPGLTVHRFIVKSIIMGPMTFQAGGYSLTTADGNSHALHGVAGTEDSNGNATHYDSFDLSGYHLQLINQDSNGVFGGMIVTDSHGSQYQGTFGAYQQCTRWGSYNQLPLPDTIRRPPTIDDAPFGDQYCSQNAKASQITDSNGNQMTLFAPGGIPRPDTLGRPLDIAGGPTTDYSGCVSARPIVSAVIASYVAPDGSTQQVKLCSAEIWIQTAFNVPGVAEAVTGTQNTSGILHFFAVVSVALADGSHWTLDYDNYGEPVYIGLPTGGSISYTWTTVAGCPIFSGLPCPSRNRRVPRPCVARVGFDELSLCLFRHRIKAGLEASWYR